VKKFFLLILLMFLFSPDISYTAEMTPASSGTPSLSSSAKELYSPDKSADGKSTPVPEITSLTPSEELKLDYDSEENNTTSPEKTKESTDTNQSAGWLTKILNMVTSLGIVCLLVYVVLKLIYAKGAGIIPQPRKNLLVMEQIHLQPQKTLILSLVKVGTRVLLIGATEKEITLLKEFEPDVFPVTSKNTSSEENNSAFKEEFSNIMDNRKKQTGILSRIFQTFGFYGMASLFNQDNLNKKR